ncbi:hypothetical protein NY2A_b661L [Paramecium bursaria Chlorella virus NY2A]|uniref:Uncharacterized protein b661L n=1 Tax=Paramecium bursaria Chlorella virus NY2A TaxID=46021 RepID=A7IXI6_PBCVN|nr:hypothetical protein NY2A_b661L [Paramecium bursaria Chlorella virus NY2A]ABT15060.1 hypothetical protein NY2A_b661L [Paramecium bursaria Chlorella virus NY2A]
MFGRSSFVTIMKCDLSTSFDERRRIETHFHFVTRSATTDDVICRVSDGIVESVETIAKSIRRFLSAIEAWFVRLDTDEIL